jgi:DNA polymerase III alpha subunit
MNIDQFGEVYFTQSQVCDLLYQNPQLDLSKMVMVDPDQYHDSIKKLHADIPRVQKYQLQQLDIENFDRLRQQQWFMPQYYQNLDIEGELLSLCHTHEQQTRVRQELLLFKKNNLLNLVRYLKYLVDTMTQNNIVWGVGRGSSVASYVLYLIGLHMVDPIKYQIPLTEFFKQGSNNE